MRRTRVMRFTQGSNNGSCAVPRQFVLATTARKRGTLRVTTAVTSIGRAVIRPCVGATQLTAFSARALPPSTAPLKRSTVRLPAAAVSPLRQTDQSLAGRI